MDRENSTKMELNGGSEKEHNLVPTGQKKVTQQKLNENEPYNLFFNAIPECPETQNQRNSITFTDLLCPSLGELKHSLQITFYLCSKWLMQQYNESGQGEKPLVVLYGEKHCDDNECESINAPNVIEHQVKLDNRYGKHHSKIGIYVYSDNSLRVVVSTANLYLGDWNDYNQGLWVSPLCPVLPKNASEKKGESPTEFKKSLLTYLKKYDLEVLNEWINYVKGADFSAIRVFLITSVPGCYNASPLCPLYRVEQLLLEHCSLPKKIRKGEGPLDWEVIAQASSFGNLGVDEKKWLRPILLRRLAAHKGQSEANKSKGIIKIIYPTEQNVRDSFYGGGCLMYSSDQHGKQKWLKNHLYQWKADQTDRTNIMPHIKTYCRISPCQTKLAWFFLTSANISKAAWGYRRPQKTGGAFHVLSNEVGVLFLPKFFDEEYFQIKINENGDNARLFAFMYDLPLTPYDEGDEPDRVKEDKDKDDDDDEDEDEHPMDA